MSDGTYRPFEGYSYPLQPQVSAGQSDVDSAEMLNLSRDVTLQQSRYASSDGYNQPSFPPQAMINDSDYNISQSSTRYGYASDDIEGLVKGNEQLPQTFRTYKRRWFGLAVLTMHSLIIGWGFTAPSVVAETAAEWYQISLETLNDLSIIGNLVFLIPAPLVIWVLNRAGPKWSMIISIAFTVLGNWIIYIAAAKHDFNVNIAGTIIHSMASAFSLCAPTRYSRLWFDDRSRTLATALPSLAYLLGAGLGAVTGPFMVQPVGPLQYDQQALIIAITLTIIAVPAPFIPSKPPTPPSKVASKQNELNAKQSILSLLRNPIFYLQLITFAILAGAIETSTNITVQALLPYGYTQQEAANAISILVFVGIGAALIVSPILDRTKQHENAIKLFSFIIAIAYTALPWIPDSHSVVPLYIAFAVIGACSISLEPAVLEYQASNIHPVSPEYATVLTFSASKAMIAILVTLVGKVLVLKTPEESQPDASLFNGLLLLAGLAWVVVVAAMFNGRWVFRRKQESLVEGNY